jgi:hypothetical protein
VGGFIECVASFLGGDVLRGSKLGWRRSFKALARGPLARGRFLATTFFIIGFQQTRPGCLMRIRRGNCNLMVLG